MSVEPATRRGRPPRIAREDILRVVGSQLEAGWTMASVARDLGVSEPAVYYYFPSKQHLQAALGDTLLEGLARPKFTGDWEAWLIATGETLFAHMVRYPFLLDVQTAALLSTGRENVLLLEEALAILTGAGFTIDSAGVALALVLAVVAQHATAALNWSREEREQLREKARALARDVHAERTLALYDGEQTWDLTAQLRLSLAVAIAGVRSELAPGTARHLRPL